MKQVHYHYGKTFTSYQIIAKAEPGTNKTATSLGNSLDLEGEIFRTPQAQ